VPLLLLIRSTLLGLLSLYDVNLVWRLHLNICHNLFEVIDPLHESRHSGTETGQAM